MFPFCDRNSICSSFTYLPMLQFLAALTLYLDTVHEWTEDFTEHIFFYIFVKQYDAELKNIDISEVLIDWIKYSVRDGQLCKPSVN